jgi:DNA gyrase subunit B
VDKYDARGITVLSGLEPVRRRPAMYIGDTQDGAGLHHMLWEVVGSGVVEHCEGTATYVRVAFHDDGAVTVEDDGGGIPISSPPREPGITTLEAVMTRLFGWQLPPSYSPTKNLWTHLAVVNALSSRLEVETCRDGRRHAQDYAAGVPQGPVRDLGATDRRGTRVTFAPDFSILRRRPWDRALVVRRLREIAALNPRLTTIVDDRAFRFPAGLADLVRSLGRGQRSLHDQPVQISGARNDVGLDVALLWTAGPCAHRRGFVNQLRTRRGTHLRGLTDGLFQAFADFDPARFGAVHRAAFREVIHTGLIAAVHVTTEHPLFSSAMRDGLENPEVATVVGALVAEQLSARLRDDRRLREALLARMPG